MSIGFLGEQMEHAPQQSILNALSYQSSNSAKWLFQQSLLIVKQQDKWIVQYLWRKAEDREWQMTAFYHFHFHFASLNVRRATHR